MSYIQEYILSLISNEDPLGRNKYLDSTMVFFNNLPDRNLVVNLDGRWGSGKSVFCRQEVVYFDAWMNDVYSDTMRRFNID